MSTSHYPQLGAQRVALALTLGATLCLFAPKTQANMLQGDGEEQAALQSVENRKYIRARTQAEKLLERRPDSFIGTWVLSQVHHYEEGNNPRALFLVRRAKDQLLRNYGARPTNVQAMSWHKKLLREESDLLGEMDRPLEEIAVLDTHDALYKPPLKRARIWPLMKLKRNDEAKEVARELILSNDVRHRVTGFNGLAAVESESYLRVRRWTVLEDGIKRTQGRACILFHNASDSALGVFRFDNAEMLAKRALKAEISDCPKASYSRLIPLYLLQGNFNGAVSAIKKLQRSPVEKRYRQQFHMETKVHLAELLWAVGKFEDGLKLADQVVNAPDRTGMTSETDRRNG